MVMASDWVHGVAHFFVIHILLHMTIRALTTCSSSALISFAVILSTPADFPFFNAFTVASISSCRMAKSSFIGGASL